MLYQLSYLGMLRGPKASEPAVYSGAGRSCPSLPGGQNAEKSRLFGIFLVILRAGNDVDAGKPAVEVDVAAAGGAERPRRLGGRLAADRAARPLAHGRGRFRALRRH